MQSHGPYNLPQGGGKAVLSSVFTEGVGTLLKHASVAGHWVPLCR